MELIEKQWRPATDEELHNIRGPVFYSANLGGAEPLLTIDGNYTWRATTVLFTDRLPPPDAKTGWDYIRQVDPTSLAPTPRRAARYLKLNAHVLFPLADWSVWFDQTHNPAANLHELWEFLRTADVACFKHPLRTTARAEAAACQELQLDTPEALQGMLRFFESVDFPDNYGLYGTACLVRRHTPQIAALNSLWWWACQRYTQRDQVILPWACWTLGIVPACLRGSPRDHDAAAGVATRPNPYFEVTVW